MCFRKLCMSIWLCTMMLFVNVNAVQALGLVNDGQGGYYASDNHDLLLVGMKYMGPDHTMWYMADLSTCSFSTWDGQPTVSAKVVLVVNTADTSGSSPSFPYVFFNNGIYHAPGGTYQGIEGSDPLRAVNVLFDRARNNGSSGSNGDSSYKKPKSLLSDEEIAIGGISPLGSSRDYIQSIYGEPNDKTKKWSKAVEDMVEHWKYGDSFEIYFYSERRESPDLILCTAANGLATPAGIKVGSRASEVIDKYGEPAFKNSSQYLYKGAADCELVFGIENGRVCRIAAGWSM